MASVDGDIFRGQSADVFIEDDGSDLLVGALQDAEITFETEQGELMGGIKILDKQRTRVAFGITASYGAFKMEGIMTILNYDKASEQIKETPEVPTFTVKGYFENTEGTGYYMELQNVDFPDASWSWSRDEYVIEDLSGEGRDIRFLDSDETALT